MLANSRTLDHAAPRPLSQSARRRIRTLEHPPRFVYARRRPRVRTRSVATKTTNWARASRAMRNRTSATSISTSGSGGGCGIRTREGLHPTRFPIQQTGVHAGSPVHVPPCGVASHTPENADERGQLRPKLRPAHVSAVVPAPACKECQGAPARHLPPATRWCRSRPFWLADLIARVTNHANRMRDGLRWWTLERQLKLSLGSKLFGTR